MKRERLRSRKSTHPLRAGGSLLCLLAPALLTACGTSSGSHPPLARYSLPIVEAFESPPADELAQMGALVGESVDHLRAEYCEANPQDACCDQPVTEECSAGPRSERAPALRDAHAKHHGCVIARWETTADASEPLATGVFAPDQRFDALIRFSNGNPTPQSDAKADGRGMAIKLMGVPGDKLLGQVSEGGTDFAEERFTQDFLLINHPRFFIPDVEKYLSFQRANQSGSSLRMASFFALNPRLFFAARALQSGEVGNPLQIAYHSMTPYLLQSREGPRAVKYMTTPEACPNAPFVAVEIGRTFDDYLRFAMKERLLPASDRPSACFAFHAIPRMDDESIEDATKEWGWDESRRVRLARLIIALQDFDSPEQRRFCEDLSFTPWHGLPGHQPMGGLNRLRLEIYEAITKERHRLNRAPRVEPRGANWSQLLENEERRR